MRRPVPWFAALFAVPAAWLAGCGAGATDWRSRPALPDGTEWHCVATGAGSFCEKSRDACDAARRYVSQRSVSVRSTGLECKPGQAPWCFTYMLTPKRPPASRELHSVREPGVDGWVYDCAADAGACQRNQARIVGDRASANEPVEDVSPCERRGQ